MKRKVWLWYAFAGGTAIGASLLGLLASSVTVPAETVMAILAKHVLRWTWMSEIPVSQELIIWNIRAPRVVLGLLIGASLSLAGAAFQGLLRNPLADPYIIGVSSGASLGAVLVLFFQFTLWGLGSFSLPVMAILGGFVALVLVFGMTHLSSRNFAVETIILSGVIMTSFMSAIVSLIIALSQREDMSQILYWLMGNVGMRGWSYAQLLLPFSIIGALLLLMHVRELNALALGEASAEHLGVSVRRKKVMILLGASLLTGASVAVSGAIGFVGLVIPHLVRLVTGPDHRHVLPLSMLIGGAYLVLADLLARTIIAPRELPIGVITALIGAPVFAFLLIRQQAGRRGRG
ncbi:iron ABC transporter permease [Xylanibacillus composti]|uniref:Putative ABC transporter permease protein YvrB n=2 Tax=Xylanibacillus composti TaxID=1572762 RepID=A0A8J4M1P7_9BACL|nr:iron ABC transporter permease [Xylanibacillus composti]GIQ67731.1 putative ABC transporter permease protein YvrB [Xylanibacillus composti]